MYATIRDFIPDYSTQSQFLVPLSKEHKDRRKMFDLAWKYYKGHHKQHLKVHPSERFNDNVTVNWTKKIVKTANSFLFGKPVMFKSENEQQQAILDEFWKDDPGRKFSQKTFMLRVGLFGEVTGTPFIRLYRSEKESGKHRLAVLRSSHIDIVTDPNDEENILEYHVVWFVKPDWYRQRIVKNKEDGLSWVILDEMWNGNKWVELQEPEQWDYDFAPIFHCPNLVSDNPTWGESSVEDADLNDAINFIVSNSGKINRLFGTPTTVITGVQPNDASSRSLGKLWKFQSSEVKAQNLEMQTDLAGANMQADRLEEAYHQVTDTPRLDPAKVSVGALSGFALRILLGPLIAKTEVKQDTYGGMFAQINRAILILSGIDQPEPVKTVWGSSVPSNPLETAQVFATLAGQGVGFEAAAEIAGYSEDQIAMISEDEIVSPL